MSAHEGSHGRYSNGCRCEPCRVAHRIYTAGRRKAALEAGELSHGLRNTYDAGCRCDKCYGARQVVYYTRERKPGAALVPSRQRRGLA